MAYQVADRVQETTATSGTGAITLAGAALNYRTFSTVMATGDTCHYAIVDPVNNVWETGTGTYNSGANTLSRVLEASSSGSLISFVGNASTMVFMSATANSLNALAPLASPTFTGTVTNTNGQIVVGNNTLASAPNIILNSAAGYNREVQWQTGGLSRWTWLVDSSSEGGSNAGSNFYLQTAADSGSFLSNVLSIIRSTGVITINNLTTSAGTLNNTSIGSSTTSTGAFTTLSASSGLNSTAIGNTATSSGAFTTLSATSGLNSTAIGNTATSSGAFTTLSATSTATLAALTSTGITASPISGSTGAFTTLSSSGLTTANSLTVSTTSTLTGVATFTAAPVLSSTTASTILGVNSSKSLTSVTLSGGLTAGSGTLTITESGIIATPNSQTVAYTAQQTDNNNMVFFTVSASTAITLPVLATGTVIEVCQYSTGKVTWTPSGVTVVCAIAGTGTRAQYSCMSFKYLSTTVVVARGDIA